jgi:PAP2 superfamily.
LGPRAVPGFVLTALVTIGVGVWLPAAGAFVHDHLPIAAHTGYVAQMQALRDGTLLRIDLRHAEGLVVFPSFHAALALLLAWGASGLRRLRWGFWIWSGAIVLVTPSEGGHYFVDVFAGVALAILVILAVRARAATAAATPAAVAAR